jgi:hypothetical protein
MKLGLFLVGSSNHLGFLNDYLHSGWDVVYFLVSRVDMYRSVVKHSASVLKMLGVILTPYMKKKLSC